MLICAAGDIHGAMDRLYEDVLAFELLLGVRFGHVLHVGDFGIWPDSSRIDKATRHHDGAGDFPVWLKEHRAVPRPTVFIKGNHEDFVWLDAHEAAEVLPGLTYLRNGRAIDIQDQTGGGIRVGGVGGMDIVLTHDAPTGVRFERHRGGTGYVSEAKGLDVLLARVRPRVCCFGHHHTRVDAEVSGIRCIGLNKVAMPGNLIAIDMEPGKRDWSLLGEFRQS